MPPAARRRRSWLFRYLRAEEYFGEILFGLIMVLTITLGASVVGRADAGGKALLYAALGCNLAWGIIDGVMYLLARLLEHGHRARLLHDVQRARNPDEALGLIAASLDPLVSPVTGAEFRRQLYDEVYQRLRNVQPQPTRLHREDLYGALLSGLLVTGSALPAAVPFLLFDDQHLALRVSNVLLIGMLFVLGVAFGRHNHIGGLRTGAAMAVIGLALVAVAIALGG